ncbi:MAG: histidinol-phosphatase HisJ family protein [Coriobacteriia bacterium]|nr:histidinol-phosphatase HisJ family protein [Coriobacteriia bacterium]
MRVDLHVHTSLCRHAEGTAAEMAEAARAAGLDVVAITDHLPLPPGFDPGYAMGADELEAYVSEVLVAAEGMRSAGGPEVLLGIEADWLPGAEERVGDAVAAYPFDVVLGSVHFLDGWAFDDPRLAGEWDRRDAGDVWRAYFGRLCAAARSGLFDAMAHPDLVKKFGHRPGFDALPLYEEAASVFAGAGVAVEVNTAGLRKPVGEAYPSLDFLAACRRAGVSVVTGSDAHHPLEVGFRLDAAEELLRAAGYESIAVVRGRRIEEIPMGVARR